MLLPPDLARKVSASLARMTERSAFFATLALYARFEESKEIKTAATDGRAIYVNRAFFEGLTAAEQDGLLLHEVLHDALLHVSRRDGRDPRLWNIAADIVINGMILKAGYTLPKDGLRDFTLESFSTEEVYEKLLKRGRAEQKAPWSDLIEGPPGDAEGQQGEQGPQGQESGTPTPSKNAATSQDDSQEAQEGYWRHAIEQAALGAKTTLAGEMPGAMLREVSNTRASRLDWRSYLWRFLTQTPTDFGDFDRRFVGRGVYLEAISGESVQVLVAVDTSGSIQGKELEVFLGEVTGILHAYPHLRCELFYADTELHGPYPLKAHTTLPRPKGGGGTDFRPFFDYIATHPFQWGTTVAIYLTDGYGRFPQHAPRCPVLWVSPAGGRAANQFPFGEVVRLLPTQHTPFVKR